MGLMITKAVSLDVQMSILSGSASREPPPHLQYAHQSVGMGSELKMNSVMMAIKTTHQNATQTVVAK